MTITKPVSELRLEVHRGKLLLKHGIERTRIQFLANDQIIGHLLAHKLAYTSSFDIFKITEFLDKLAPTLSAQILNNLLSQYAAPTVAKLALKKIDNVEHVTNIKFVRSQKCQ
jgi:hypothetical protein